MIFQLIIDLVLVFSLMFAIYKAATAGKPKRAKKARAVTQAPKALDLTGFPEEDRKFLQDNMDLAGFVEPKKAPNVHEVRRETSRKIEAELKRIEAEREERNRRKIEDARAPRALQTGGYIASFIDVTHCPNCGSGSLYNGNCAFCGYVYAQLGDSKREGQELALQYSKSTTACPNCLVTTTRTGLCGPCDQRSRARYGFHTARPGEIQALGEAMFRSSIVLPPPDNFCRKCFLDDGVLQAPHVPHFQPPIPIEKRKVPVF